MTDAVVLAGGRGTRLRSSVPNRPKPMADIAGRPFLEYVLAYLSGQGVTHVVLSVGFMWKTIAAHFGSRFERMGLTYAVETKPLGTGGGLRNALIYTRDDPIWVLNGDTLAAIPLSRMSSVHRPGRVTMAVVDVRDPST